MKKNILVLCKVVPLALFTFPTTITSCFKNKNGGQELAKYSRVYNFLNDRTFSISIQLINSGSLIGTTWLFYHVPSDISGNDYTYYSLTNLHVGGAINYIINAKDEYGFLDTYVCLAYQTFDELKNPNAIIDFNQFHKNPNQHGSSKIFAIDKVNYTKDSVKERTTNYSSLFAQYSTLDGVDSDTYRIYMDVNIIKLNLNESVNNDPILKERLDRLNVYAEQHNNYTINFLNEKENNINIVNNLFSLGYPMIKIDPSQTEERYIINNHSIRCQQIHWSDMPCKYNNRFPAWEIDFVKWTYVQMCLTPGLYGDITESSPASGKNYIYLGGSNITVNNPLYGDRDFGGGSSGSCGLYASNVNDESSYAVAGIYWGFFYDEESTPVPWWPCYQSFSYDWSGVDNIINNFFNDYDWSKQEPTDKFIKYDWTEPKQTDKFIKKILEPS